jgi:hypothetical protein
VRVSDASAFALAVQWHPEWRYWEDPFAVRLFAAFGDAVRARAGALFLRGRWLMSDMESWLRDRRVNEVECLVPDMSGIARGKILPSSNSCAASSTTACACRKASSPRP